MGRKSEVVIDKDGDSFAITSVHLSIVAKTPGIDEATFQSIAMKAKTGCPVSKLMNTNIGFALAAAVRSCDFIEVPCVAASSGRSTACSSSYPIRRCKTRLSRHTQNPDRIFSPNVVVHAPPPTVSASPTQ